MPVVAAATIVLAAQAVPVDQAAVVRVEIPECPELQTRAAAVGATT
jgi:hypothetical protein